MKKIALLILGIFCMLESQAQIPSLEIVRGSLLFTNLSTGQSDPDTLFLNYGDSIQISADVVYNSPNFVLDTLGLGIAEDSINGTTTGFLFSILPADTLFNQDTTTVIVRDIADSTVARYSGGTGGGAVVVVVWPVLRSTPSINENSSVVTFNYEPRMASISPIVALSKRVICFPNPIQERLFFEQKSASAKLEYVRITNLQGQEVFVSSSLPSSLATATWPHGMYLIEIRYADHMVTRMKIEK